MWRPPETLRRNVSKGVNTSYFPTASFRLTAGERCCWLCTAAQTVSGACAAKCGTRELPIHQPDKGATMRTAAYLLSMGLAGLLSVSATRLGVADDADPKIRHFTAAQLKALVAHPADGMAFNQFLKGPSSEVYIIRRDKTGETEIHMAFNDIYFVESGHAKITIGGHVTGNPGTTPGEWRGGAKSGRAADPLGRRGTA